MQLRKAVKRISEQLSSVQTILDKMEEPNNKKLKVEAQPNPVKTETETKVTTDMEIKARENTQAKAKTETSDIKTDVKTKTKHYTNGREYWPDISDRDYYPDRGWSNHDIGSLDGF